MASHPIQWDKIDRTAVEAVTLDEAGNDVDFWLSRPPADRWAGIEHLRRAFHGDAAVDGRLPRLLELVELGAD